MTRSPDLWTLLVRVGSLRGLTAGPGPEAAPWGGAGRPESWPVLGGSPPPRPPDPPGAAGSCRGRAGGPPAESCPTRAGALARGPTELEGPGACVSRGWAHPINRGAAEPHWPVGGNCGPPPHEHVHHTVGQTQGTEDAFGGCLGHVQARGLTAGEFVWTTWRQPLQPGKFRRPARGPRLRADRSSHPEAPNDRPPRPTSSSEPWETRVCEPRDGSRVQRTGTGPGAKEAALTQTWPGGGGSPPVPRGTRTPVTGEAAVGTWPTLLGKKQVRGTLHPDVPRTARAATAAARTPGRGILAVVWCTETHAGHLGGCWGAGADFRSQYGPAPRNGDPAVTEGPRTDSPEGMGGRVLPWATSFRPRHVLCLAACFQPELSPPVGRRWGSGSWGPDSGFVLHGCALCAPGPSLYEGGAPSSSPAGSPAGSPR